MGISRAGADKLKRAVIRGIESFSMICSEKELGISEEHDGVIILDGDAPVGIPWWTTWETRSSTFPSCQYGAGRVHHWHRARTGRRDQTRAARA
jgi:hypothetical protein